MRRWRSRSRGPGCPRCGGRRLAPGTGGRTVVPVERQRGSLPRWVRDPRVMDWLADEDVAGHVEKAFESHLEWERFGGTLPPGGVPPGPDDVRKYGMQMAHLDASYRFIEGLDLAYGRDAWPSAWADARMPWETAPGGPPAALVAAVRERRAVRPAGTDPGLPDPADSGV